MSGDMGKLSGVIGSALSGEKIALNTPSQPIMGSRTAADLKLYFALDFQ